MVLARNDDDDDMELEMQPTKSEKNNLTKLKSTLHHIDKIKTKITTKG